MGHRVLIVGDTHCPGMLKGYPNFLSKTFKKYNCNRVVLIGDVVDNGAISYHEKHPGLSSPAQEFKDAKKQVSQLYARFPKADWIMGNHDALTQRQAVTAGLLPEWLRDPADIWGVPGWTVHERFSTLTIDGVDYLHGDSGKAGQFAAVKTSRARFRSVVMGHCHSEAGVWWTCNANARIFGLNVGVGLDYKRMMFEYGRKFINKPVVGCGVVLDGLYPIFEPMIL